MTQLYTVHGAFMGKFLPLVFVLLSHKDELSYSAMLSRVKELCPGWEPGLILTDFEKAAQNAYAECLPNSKLKACHFHLCQNYQKKIGEVGLKVRYEQDPEFALSMRMVPCLSFLPPHLVEKGFEALEDHFTGDEDADKIQAILNYFEDTYIGKETYFCNFPTKATAVH